MGHLRLFLLLLTFIQIFLSSSEVFSLDTNVFKFFPLKVGNRWTWYRSAYPTPGPGYETMKILNSVNTNNHLYYVSRYDAYLSPGVLYYTKTYNLRIDSITGNLYDYNTQTQTECLNDSLAASKNDSSFCSCSLAWFRCDTGTYNIFNQSPKTKIFTWWYFEGGGSRTYAKNFGRVYETEQRHVYSASWTLRGCLINGILYGDTSLTGINKISSEVPEKFKLFQNYPNPFNPVTSFKFQVPRSGLVSIIVYDALGREVQILANEKLSPGTYEIEFDGKDLPSGVYYYTLTSGDPSHTFRMTKKMVLIK